MEKTKAPQRCPYRKDAERALARVLANRHKIKPDVIKPDRLEQFGSADVASLWKNFNWRDFFEYRIIEERKPEAEKIGIVYEKRLIEVVPEMFRSEMLRKLIEFRNELEESLKAAETRTPDRTNPALQEQALLLQACQNPENFYWVHLSPLIPQEAHLNHDKALFPWDGNGRPDHAFFEAFIDALKNGVLRNPKASDWRTQLTYLKKYDMDVDGDSVFGSGETQVRFHINIAKLLESRNIFTDPEGMAAPEEYGRTFMVQGGIPINCIEGWSFWENDERPSYVKLP